MIVLTQGNTSQTFVVTLTENTTVSMPSYHFSCIDTNNNIVTFTFTSNDDISVYPLRYNEFNINTAAVFAGLPAGTFQYSVTEVQTQIVLEVGKLELKQATDFNFTGYESNTIYKGYGG